MPPGIEPGEPDPIDDLIRSAGVRRRPSAMDEPDPIDDLIQSAGIRRRPSALDALDAGEAESGSRLMDSAAPSENVLQAQGWARAISVAIAVLAMAGLLTDTVAASQLLADSGPGALAVVVRAARARPHLAAPDPIGRLPGRRSPATPGTPQFVGVGRSWAVDVNRGRGS